MSVSQQENRLLRAGIIGCGWFGRVHVERLSELSGVAVCAVSDPDEAARQKLAANVPAQSRDPQSPEIAAYADHEELLRHPGLDFVVIASPNRWHVRQLVAAVEQGLHVLCEKPLTLIPDEVNQAVEATQKSSKIVAVAYQSRYRRDSRLLRLALQSGKWGKVTSIVAFAGEDWVTPNVGTWRHDPARCPGGYFGDANSHQLDLLCWLTDMEAAWVRATMETRGTPVPIVNYGEARLRPQGGIGYRVLGVGENAASETHNTQYPTPNTIPFVFSFVGDSRRWREEISIQTERADFVLRDTKLLWTDGTNPLAPFTESDLGIAEAIEADTPDSAFVAALRGGPPVVSAPETVWPVLRFTLTALASAEAGGEPQKTE